MEWASRPWDTCCTVGSRGGCPPPASPPPAEGWLRLGSGWGIPAVWLAICIGIIPIAVYVVSFFLMQALSRYREFAADRGAALITGAPEQLMSALQKIASQITRIPQRDLREVEAMNAFFIIPTNWRSSFGELFMTHPPMEKRLAALARVAREMGRTV